MLQGMILQIGFVRLSLVILHGVWCWSIKIQMCLIAEKIWRIISVFYYILQLILIAENSKGCRPSVGLGCRPSFKRAAAHGSRASFWRNSSPCDTANGKSGNLHFRCYCCYRSVATSDHTQYTGCVRTCVWLWEVCGNIWKEPKWDENEQELAERRSCRCNGSTEYDLEKVKKKLAFYCINVLFFSSTIGYLAMCGPFRCISRFTGLEVDGYRRWALESREDQWRMLFKDNHFEFNSHFP